MKQRWVLVIEDDPDGRRSVTEALEDAGYAVTAVEQGGDGVREAARCAFDTVVSDVRLPDMDGLEVLRQIKAHDAQVPVILMTAYGSVASAVAALKAGAYDYLLKPLDLEDIQAKVARALETRRLKREVRTLRRSFRGAYAAEAMVVRSAPMQAVMRQVRAVADTDATVLITGESGTGKELVARALHVDGRRSDGPFVAVNCGAFSESLLESELFGHERGAFTGAVARHEGAFERADGGTLFLDEIGIAPLSVQRRLLRALEQREVLRVGGKRPVSVDARVISATNRELSELVAEGEFLEDLLYRLQVVWLRIPPLRERVADIRPLAEQFIAGACREHGRYIEAANESYFHALAQRRWPGNVRELRNAVESSVILAADRTLRAADLNATPPAAAGETPRLTIPPNTPMRDIEKAAVAQALQRNEGSRALAAGELGVSTRTIQRKIKEHRLPF